MVDCRFEPLSYLLLNGLPNLAFSAWQETEFCREHPNVPYSPDWESYQNLEDNNKLRLVALREDGDLIGYASIVIDNDIHRAGVIFANLRDIFITETKRGHAAKFVRFIEKQLTALGVQRVYAAERVEGKNPAKFYQIMGFKPQEVLWGKTLH